MLRIRLEMPNPVHLILTPSSADGLSRAVGEAHRRFTAFVNARARLTGHLFQARFASFAMDDAHLLNAVRAGLAAPPDAWPWSSVAAHLKGRDDALVEVAPVLARASRRRGAATLQGRAKAAAWCARTSEFPLPRVRQLGSCSVRS